MIKHWLISTIAILIAAYVVPGVTTTLIGACVFAIILGLINIFIKPIIFILTLPITIVTLGLFSLVINAFLVLFASRIVEGFSVSGFFPALIFAIVLALIEMFFGNKKD